MDPAHSYDMKPNRLPQVPDIVGDELTILCKNPQKTFPASGNTLHTGSK